MADLIVGNLISEDVFLHVEEETKNNRRKGKLTGSVTLKITNRIRPVLAEVKGIDSETLKEFFVQIGYALASSIGKDELSKVCNDILFEVENA